MEETSGVPVPVRALALAGLGVAQLVTLVVALALLVPVGVGVVFTLPPSVVLGRFQARLARRLAGRWSGVDIADPYLPPPPPPEPEPDGMYRIHDALVKRRRVAAYFHRMDWLSSDPASWRDLRWLLAGPVLGIPLALLAVLGGRPVLRLHGRWTRLLLRARPPGRRVIRQWLRPRLTATLRVLALSALTALEIGVALVTLVGFGLGFGLGMVFLIPSVVAGYRWLAVQRRQLAGEWLGVVIEEPYRPPPPPLGLTGDGRYRVDNQLFKTARMANFHRRISHVLGDTATWRELLWTVIDPVVGGPLVLIPSALVIVGIWVVAIPSLWLRLGFSDPRPETAAWMADLLAAPWLAIPAGLLLALVGVALAPGALRLHTRWSAVLLRPTEAARLARRVDQLTRTRADASDAQAAELRRIERDLHDGAQARLIAVGLHLGALERLIDTDPVRAKALVAQARETSARALADLRDLVRGIHPPVLAERGLGDAVRALALDSPLSTTVVGELPGRAEAPIESAAYFAVAELLGNAAKHAGAASVRVALAHDGELLLVTVTDDGRGGADPARGSGLRGIERRLSAFDGKVTVVSPPGGPTAVTLELPCVLSSPRTSTSSGTA